ncbi:O-methyltransferase ZRP4 [Zea mays]|uniref:O-methyltransferase ZRP4 n=1 Tax=Zea mays TaxID=4577 RepID=A0A3L6EB76_MAIZE|nr:O-methyltransferase ZRP4 [Zea mays]
MAPANVQHTSTNQQTMLDAQLQLWHHTIGYVKSMALKAAVDLRIADAIHQHGGSATLPQIVTKVTLQYSTRPRYHACGASCVFSLLPASSASTPAVMSPFTGSRRRPALCTFFVSSFLDLNEWFQHETGPSPFELANGRDIWALSSHDASFGKLFDDGMVADSVFIMEVVVKECGDVFRGVGSLVDVAGGLGGATQTIAKAFPDMECSVLDLSHVVANAPTDTTVKYIAGDMFESIPSANVVFLKWILHDWSDAECVKILKNCKKAIGSQEEGKVVILDMVVGAGSSDDEKHVETQIVFDLFMMFINGTERDETEWKKIIFEAGFSHYKIIPVFGVRSIIEVYP